MTRLFMFTMFIFNVYYAAFAVEYVVTSEDFLERGISVPRSRAYSKRGSKYDNNILVFKGQIITDKGEVKTGHVFFISYSKPHLSDIGNWFGLYEIIFLGNDKKHYSVIGPQRTIARFNTNYVDYYVDIINQFNVKPAGLSVRNESKNTAAYCLDLRQLGWQHLLTKYVSELCPPPRAKGNSHCTIL